MNLYLCFYILLLLMNLLVGLRRNKETGICVKVGNQRFGKDQGGHLISLLLMLYLMFLIINNENNPDFLSYKHMYDNDVATDIGWMFFEDCFKKLGCSFETFRACVVVASCLLIWVGHIKLKVNENIVLLLYAIYPFAMDAIQLRNFLALSILVFASSKLLLESSKGKLVWCIASILAGLIQTIFPIYLLAILVDFKHPKARKNKLLMAIFGCSLLCIVLFKIWPAGVLLVGNTLFSRASDKIEYYVQGNVGFGFLIYGLMHILLTLAVWCASKVRCKFTQENPNVLKRIFWLDIALACTLPLCIIHIEFYRIFRNLCLMNYIAVPILLQNRTNKYRLTGLLSFFSGYALYICMDYFNYVGRFEYVFLPFFGE